MRLEFDLACRLFNFQRGRGGRLFSSRSRFFGFLDGFFFSKLGVGRGACRLAFDGAGFSSLLPRQSCRALFDGDGIVVGGPRPKLLQRGLFGFRRCVQPLVPDAAALGVAEAG